MNEKMYVINMKTGSHEEYNVEVIFITNDLEKGTAYVNNKNDIYASLRQKEDSFYQNEHKQWLELNPRANIAEHQLINIPKWQSNIKVTKEMRDERKSIELKNNKIIQKANEPVREWYKNYQAFIHNWWQDNLTVDELKMFRCMNQNYWEIQEVKWL